MVFKDNSLKKLYVSNIFLKYIYEEKNKSLLIDYSIYYYVKITL